MDYKGHKKADYQYDLPNERIAKFPLPKRDTSKLLIYNHNKICEDNYLNICSYIPKGTLLILNDTKVIPARIRFIADSGSEIEIFCLEAVNEDIEPASLMTKIGSVHWKCLIGNLKKWNRKLLKFQNASLIVTAELIAKSGDTFIVEFKWDKSVTFAEVIDQIGVLPIPPYLKRESQEIDKTRYQTTYAQQPGSVAAPTAGLHFTETVFTRCKERGIDFNNITLHVGAGTFKPIKSETIEGHEMHAEWIDVKSDVIRRIIDCLESEKSIIAVGTTSLRTIESLYWMGVKSQSFRTNDVEMLTIKQWDPYEVSDNIKPIDALNNLLDWMNHCNLTRLICRTQIIIVPPYKLKIANAIITNFHQPESTLLLLIAAIVGEKWKVLYDYALKNNFRFLSYGDGSLLFSDHSTHVKLNR